jgi:hypothetical protein
MPHPDTSHNLHLIDIRHGVELNSGCYGGRWHLKLKHLNLQLKRGNHRCPLLKLKLLLLVAVLEVYDRVSALIHKLAWHIKLLMNVVPRVLGLVAATICNLQLLVLVWRRNCTTMEKVILTLQLHELTWDGYVAPFISSHTQALLDDSPHKALLPHGVPLIVNQKERDWHRGGVTEVTPTQGSEGDLCRLLNGVV